MDTENRPVLTGLVALVGVAVVIGLLGGLAVLVGVKATGIGESTGASADPSASATFRLPKPSETSTETTPEETTEPSAGAEPTSEAPATGISLSASQQSVSPMQQIDLTGTYQAGEGAILQVQRMENGAWSDFPVTMSVSGGTFATYVQTSRTGPNEFRVVDTDSDVVSNEVTVTVG
ncbi:hypothetical protein ACNKF0_20430 [Nocardioides sp. T5]|uniref:hypothetical protein n=1 Tax=Nocardioides sp. T5 TaxID=3400182 RepID=UPI003A87D7BD